LTAAVPVVKLIVKSNAEFKGLPRTGREFLIHVDITIDIADYFGQSSHALRTTQLVQNCILQYPYFFEHILLLKFILAQKQFTNSYSGGISSYGLTLLYLAFLGPR
jgi:DNA polymerase sigma